MMRITLASVILCSSGCVVSHDQIAEEREEPIVVMRSTLPEVQEMRSEMYVSFGDLRCLVPQAQVIHRDEKFITLNYGELNVTLIDMYGDKSIDDLVEFYKPIAHWKRDSKGSDWFREARLRARRNPYTIPVDCWLENRKDRKMLLCRMRRDQRKSLPMQLYVEFCKGQSIEVIVDKNEIEIDDNDIAFIWALGHALMIL